MKEGKGVLIYNNGDKYEGEWKKDKKEGEGVFIDRNGKYEGEYKNDMKEGKGTIYYNNGNVYDA